MVSKVVGEGTILAHRWRPHTRQEGATTTINVLKRPTEQRPAQSRAAGAARGGRRRPGGGRRAVRQAATLPFRAGFPGGAGAGGERRAGTPLKAE